MDAENCAHEHKSGRPVHSQITSDNEHPPFRVKKPPSLHGLGKCAHEHKALLQGSTAGLPGKWQTSPRAEKSSSTHGFGKCAHEHKTFPATIPFKVCARCENWSLSCEKAPSSPRIRKCAHEHKALPAGIGSWIAMENGRPNLERRSPLLLKDSEIVLMSTKWILQRIWLWISSAEGRCALLGGMVSSPHGFEKCVHEHKNFL